MSAQASPPAPRHALGLPAGSIRALLALSILALLWLLVLFPDRSTGAAQFKLPPVFVYLQMLMVMILVHFFGAHGASIRPARGDRSPLGLPRGSVRLLLLVGYGGLVYYLYKHQSKYDIFENVNVFMPLALMLSGFFVGHYLTGLVKVLWGGQLPYWVQDTQAWLALLAVIGLTCLLIIHVFINPTVSPELQIGSVQLDMGLAAIIGFYFGSRS